MAYYSIFVLSLIIFFCLFVFSDLLQNPLVVPLKLLKEHDDCSDFGIFGVTFHPTEPWVLSCGADKTIRLFT